MVFTPPDSMQFFFTADEADTIQQALSQYRGPYQRDDLGDPREKNYHDERMVLAKQMHTAINEALCQRMHAEQDMEYKLVKTFKESRGE